MWGKVAKGHLPENVGASVPLVRALIPAASVPLGRLCHSARTGGTPAPTLDPGCTPVKQAVYSHRFGARHETSPELGC